MNLKSKLRFSKSIATIIGLVCIVASCFIFQGCEKEEYNSPDRDEIINSIEFEEYIVANIELASKFQEANSMLKNAKLRNSMKTGVTPDGVTYRTCPFKIDQSLLKTASTKGEVFLKKYPLYKTYGTESKKDLISKAMAASEPINKLLLKKGLNIKQQQSLRLKSGAVEGSEITNNSGFMNALMYTMWWACLNQYEVSGYLFADGGAFIYFNSNATCTSTSYAGPIYNYCDNGIDLAIYNGHVVQATFHTHFRSPLFSDPISNPDGPNDLTVQQNYFPNSDLIILFNDNVYVYHFEDGVYLP